MQLISCLPGLCAINLKYFLYLKNLKKNGLRQILKFYMYIEFFVHFLIMSSNCLMFFLLIFWLVLFDAIVLKLMRKII